MVDVTAVCEAYSDRTMINIGFIHSGYNPADGLTKAAPNEALMNLLKSGKIDHPIEQFVVENMPIAQVDT
jgi:hypothetical protein